MSEHNHCPICGSGDWDSVGCGTCGHSDTASTAPQHGKTQEQNEVAHVEIRRRPHFAGPQELGNIPSLAESEPPAGDPVSRAKSLAAAVMNRLKAEKRWFGLVDLVRDQMMREAKPAYPDLVQRQLWVYSELDRMYPPVQSADQGIRTYDDKCDTISQTPHLSPLLPTKAPSLPDCDTGAIQGLSDLPEGWPELPANASPQAELAWVQANRLRIVDERPGRKTLVSLAKALTPAPSWSALGWLETSIRSYAKFIDVSAKVVGTTDDEGDVIKRERKSVDEIRALLREMEAAAGTCPSCGRLFESAGN
jgi:hypothetical protein